MGESRHRWREPAFMGLCYLGQPEWTETHDTDGFIPETSRERESSPMMILYHLDYTKCTLSIISNKVQYGQ